MTIWRRVECWISKATRAQAHVPSRAHTHTQARARMNTHAQTHTHTEICNTYCFSTANKSGFVNAPHCYVIRTLLV